jgi:tungstate transport system ATP-binding protein
MSALFSLHNIEINLGEHFKLDIPQLELKANEVYVFTGPNGAGKSTLLKLLSHLNMPTRGELRFMGEQVQNDPARLTRLRRQITMVEQTPYLFSGSVAYNIAYGLQLRGVRSAEQQSLIANALETVGLDGFGQRKVSELSGGEAQRVALARALVLEPRVLVLDEPTANIDHKSLAAIEGLLAKLPQRGVSVIMTSHDKDQPKRVGGKVMSISEGRLCNTQHSHVWQQPEPLTDGKKLWPQPLTVQGI